ncbi:MAG: DNA polymerase III subunit gamma/tau [Bacilli bacterium]|nr:DNA polymerase III subunit gamma/tau [Bacilli bacterium]
MSYRVLYRKYRPHNFDDIIDQKYITDTLRESIVSNKISHAYIFSGPKGTGKTSTAKVFAKAINCEHPVNGNPCEECNSCKNFNSSSDIIELDAASNNSVDDIREIVNNVKLAPNSSKYKIYIIDEAHMLTNSASNAFLLTLEEPPAHVIFILATTNPESLPLTILSRCQQFAFSKISKPALINRLKYVLDNENIKLTDEVIEEIANYADGGLRDALSILDQLVTLSKPITVELLTEQFGIISVESINNLINAILNADVNTIDSLFNSYIEHGISEKSFVYKFISVLSNKICDLKTNSFGENIDSLKNIVNEVLELDINKKSISYFEIIKMIIITNMNIDSKSVNKDNKIISQEINLHDKVEDTSENIEFVETQAIEDSSKEEPVVENNSIEDVHDEQIPDEIVNNDVIDNQNLQEVNEDYQKLIEVRINNSFAGAEKKLKLEFVNNYESYISKTKENNELYSLLVDTEVGVVSPTNVILVADSEAASNLLNENSFLISKLGGFDNKKIVFVNNNEWKLLIEEYTKNIKTKKEYTYMEEPKIDVKEKIYEIANDVFGDSDIIVEDE